MIYIFFDSNFPISLSLSLSPFFQIFQSSNRLCREFVRTENIKCGDSLGNMTDEEPKRKRMKTGDEEDKDEKKYVVFFFFVLFFLIFSIDAKN